MKKFKAGDRVRFLNEPGGGIITAIKNADEVIVQIEDGLEIPYPVKELILDNKSIIIQSASKPLNDISTPDKEVIYLAIESNTPQLKNCTEYYFYLFNLSKYQFYYTYSVGKNNTMQCLAHGLVHPFEKQRIKSVSALLLKDIDTHHIQTIFFQDDLYNVQTPIFESIKLNEKTFSNANFITHSEFQNPVFIIFLKENFSVSPSDFAKQNSSQNIRVHLSDNDWEKIHQLKEKPFYKSKQKSYTQKKYQEEITLDLHIEELVENPAHLSSHQKLQIQLDYFEKELHNAIANNVKKITVIHGVGNGRLKYEVREYLKNVDEVKNIEDAPYKTHGYGATVVYIK